MKRVRHQLFLRFFYISTNTTISPGGERRLIVSVVRVSFFSMYTEASKKKKTEKEKEILCQFDKHSRHLVTQLSKKTTTTKELACYCFSFRSRQIYPRTVLLSLMLVVGCRINHSSSCCLDYNSTSNKALFAHLYERNS